MATNTFDPTETAAAVTGAKPIKATGGTKPGHHPPPKKKIAAPAPAQVTPTDNFPKPGDPYWKTHPIMTEHSDGTVRQWGEDTIPHVQNPNLLPKQMLPPQPVMSDKAAGLSSTYYPSQNQNKGKAIPTIKSNNNQ